MKAGGQITHGPRKSLRLLVTAQLLWLALVCVLGGWWGTLVLRQASRIAELESAQGLSSEVSLGHWQKTQLMVYGESSTFFALLLASTGLLFWLYWRDTQRSRGLEAFFASVTHELRTPLTSIRLQAESISDSLPDSGTDVKIEEQRKLLGRLLEDSSRLESQVERTLELARLEGGGPLFPHAISLSAWLDKSVASWKGRSSVRSFRVVPDLSLTRNLAVLADPAALDVILKNLIENSLRHSERPADASSLEISVKAERTPGWIAIHFSDNGTVFTGNPARLGQLFQKGKDSKGAGVGLYLIQALMKRMGGKARFKAQLGEEGFTTSLFFPEAPAENLEGDAP